MDDEHGWNAVGTSVERGWTQLERGWTPSGSSFSLSISVDLFLDWGAYLLYYQALSMQRY